MEFCVFDFVCKNDSDDKYFDVSESVSHFISFQENENEEADNIYFSNILKLNSNGYQIGNTKIIYYIKVKLWKKIN